MTKLFDNMNRAILKSSLSEYVTINNKRIKIIHFGEWVSVDPDSGAPVTSSDPKIALKTSHLSDSDLSVNNVVLLRKKKYCISDIQRDGEGMAELILKKTK